MQRLRELVDSDDPAVAGLARLVDAAAKLRSRPGAHAVLRAGLSAHTQSPPWWRQRLLALLVFACSMPVAAAGVSHVIVHWATEPAPSHEPPTPPAQPVASAPVRHASTRPRLVPSAPSAILPPTPEEPIALGESSTTAPATLPPAAAERGAAAGARTSTAGSPPRAAEAPGSLPARSSPAASSRVAASPEATSPMPANPEATNPTPANPEATNPTPASQVVETPAEDEAALVQRALHAVRAEHNAKAALDLLAAYRRRFPDGDLAEEVLALEIEARAARDDAAAHRLADEYLQKFPHGRFRAAAERARQRFAVPP